MARGSATRWWPTPTSRRSRPQPDPAAPGAAPHRTRITQEVAMKEWPLWEIFIRSQHGLAHKHVGSLHAPDGAMAINNARDVYTRRNEGVSVWAVKAGDVV